MNKNYVSGRNFEYRVATIFRRKGYYVTRSAGSHGVADLVAVKRGRKPVFLQCKHGEGGISIEEQNTLFKTALEVGAIPIVALGECRKPTVFKQIMGISIITGDAERVVKGADF